MSSLYGDSDIEQEGNSELTTIEDSINLAFNIDDCIQPFILSYSKETKFPEYLEIHKEIEYLQDLTISLDPNYFESYFKLIKAIQVRINLKNNNREQMKAILKSQEKFEKDAESSFRETFYHLVHEIISTDSTNQDLKSLLTLQIIQSFIETLKSELNIERELVKRIIHLIYSKFMTKRKFIRNALNHFLEHQMHENQTKGISEVLELFDCLIKGFIIPLKPEHLRFFKEVLLPLHKLKQVSDYSDGLRSCCKSFISKDESLLPGLLDYLIKHWPVRNAEKSVVFINVFFDFIRTSDAKAFDQVAVQFFEIVLKSAFDVFEKLSSLALVIINDQKFQTIYLNNSESLKHLIKKVLKKFKNSEKFEVLSRILSKLDSDFAEVNVDKESLVIKQSREELWKRFQETAILIDPSLAGRF